MPLVPTREDGLPAVNNRFVKMLMDELEGARMFPPPREQRYREDLEMFSAIRESNADKLAPKWWFEDEDTRKRDYVVDPLGERIPQVWSDMLFGEEAEIRHPQKNDQQKLEELIDTNDLPAFFGWAEELNSSEGEVWYRHVSEPKIGHCTIEWHSRLNVIPLFMGRKLVAAAVFSILGDDEDHKNRQWVYVEYHGEGTLHNRLYMHNIGSALGQPVKLTERPETEELQPRWEHKIPELLCGRIVNRWGRDWRIGVSDFQGIAGLLLLLNETTNIGQENVRLTAKQRVVIPERFLSARGELPRGAEVIIATEVDADPDKIKNEFAQIEWEFDAEALVKYKSDLVDTILTRARVAPQLVGRHTETAQTGPALRARILDSILAAQGKGKEWDDHVPEILVKAALVESLPKSDGGLGNAWNAPDKEPTFKRKSPLPEDEESRSRRTVQEVNADILSRRTAVVENHPEWSDERVNEEMTQIETEAKQRAERLPTEPTTSRSDDGRNAIPDPAGGIARKPGERTPTAVPDADRTVRT